jgi:L-threonylcarbamoyladenylate synthase
MICRCEKGARRKAQGNRKKEKRNSKRIKSLTTMDFREDIDNAMKALREGGVILYPTDTVWGLGCDATNESAVAKIFEIKKRIDSKSLIVLVNGITMLERYVRSIPHVASELIDVSDKPITIVYPAGKNFARGVCNEDGSVGIRITFDSFCNEIISRLRKPIVSTSANYSGAPAPGIFTEIDEAVVRSVSYVVRYRQDDNTKHKPSPVIKVNSDGTLKIIRT